MNTNSNMKKFFYKVALMLHPRYAAVLRAAKNVRAGKEDSQPLRIAWRFYMLAWQGNAEYGKARADERHAEIQRLYGLFAEPKSSMELFGSTKWCIDELYKAGQLGMVSIPKPEEIERAKMIGLDIDEAKSYNESMEFLQLLKRAAMHPILFAAVYSD